MLLSNSLDLNKGANNETASYNDGFPTWLKPRVRKLLQSTNPTANIVVAQDGSGNYRTVNEAIAAARAGTVNEKFVILVRAGTYQENVDISVNNIMLLGDGIGRTIITGSRSVDGGSTTFKSATVGT